MPVVKFGPVRTDDPKSKLIDTNLPVQSFFINVGRSIDSLTSASSIAEFLAFEPNFGNSAFSDTYWDSLDQFNHSTILATLKPDSKKRKLDSRKLRFQNLKRGISSKSLPPPSAKGSPIKRQSDSELPPSSRVRHFDNDC